MIGSISYCKTSSGAEVGIIVWAMLGLFPCLFRINSNNGNNYMVNGKDIRLDVNKYYSLTYYPLIATEQLVYFAILPNHLLS